MKLGLVVFALLFAIQSLADFNGNWKGQGNAREKFGGNEQGTSSCEVLNIEISIRSDRVTIPWWVFVCNNWGFQRSVDAQIVGNDLLQNGKVIGSISSDLLYIGLPNPGPADSWYEFTNEKDGSLTMKGYEMFDVQKKWSFSYEGWFVK